MTRPSLADRKFVDAYLGECEGVAWKAAVAAGSKAKTDRSRRDAGARFLRKPTVQALIVERRAEIMKRADIQAQEVAERLANIARASPLDVVTLNDNRDTIEIKSLDDIPDHQLDSIRGITRLADGSGYRIRFNDIRLKDIDSLPPEVRDAISEIGVSRTGRVRVKFHDKIGALNALAKYLGMFIERHHHKHDVEEKVRVKIYLPSNGRRRLMADGEMPANAPPPIEIEVDETEGESE